MTNCELDAAIAEKVMDHSLYIGNWSPSTDRNAAALVLERIAELGLAEKLVNALSPTLPGTNSYSMQVWTHIVATPRQLMEAALAAVGVAPENDKASAPETQRDAKE